MYSIFAYFIVFSLVFVTYTYVLKYFNIFSLETNKYSINSKYEQLDGLRGILSISVIFHHSIIMYNYYIIEIWKVPPSNFYTLLGQISVSMFFIITGFLFGFKLFGEEFKTKQFFISRIRRIIPLQIFSVLVVFFIILYLDNFVLKVNFNDLFKTFFMWVRYKVSIINENENSYIIETVYWTLKKEWTFYIILPILFFLNKMIIKNNYILLVLLLILSIFSNSIFILLFFIGILVSFIVKNNLFYKINKIKLNMIAIISIIIIFLYFNNGYNFIVSILLFILFLSIIITGCCSKILLNKIFIIFGQASYSIYLLHNIIIFIVFYFINTYIKPISQISVFEYWIIVYSVIIFTIVLSIQTYKYIEYRFYNRHKYKGNNNEN